MIHRVNEIQENFIHSNGDFQNTFKFYQGGNSNVLNNPYLEDASDWFFFGYINFVFDNQYSYNNYKASTIDGLTVISTLVMMYFIVWKMICYYVQCSFYHHLTKVIIKTDEEV